MQPYSTLLPRLQGRCFWTAAGFTASRDSHPRQDLCRPPSCLPAGLDGSIIIPDAVIAIHQPPQLASWTDGPAYTLLIGRHSIKAGRAAESNKTEKVTSFPALAFTDGLRASSNVAAPHRAHQESIQNIGYEIIKEQWKGEITLPLLSRKKQGGVRNFFLISSKKFSVTAQ